MVNLELYRVFYTVAKYKIGSTIKTVIYLFFKNAISLNKISHAYILEGEEGM